MYSHDFHAYIRPLWGFANRVRWPMVRPWLFWTVLAIASWGVWGVLSELAGDSLSGAHSQLLSTAGMLPILVWLLITQRWRTAGKEPSATGLAFAAGIVSCLGNVLFFGVLQQQGAKAATVIPFTSLAPLVTALLAIPILRERLNWVQTIGLSCSLVAIYLFNVPDGPVYIANWIWPACLTTLLWGAAGLLQKCSTLRLTGPASMVWFLWSFLALAVILYGTYGLPSVISARTWCLTFAMGFTLALGNLAILLAFADHGKASIIAPLCGLYPLVSVPLAMFIIGESLSRREGIAAVVSLVAVMAMAWETTSLDSPPVVSSSQMEGP